MTERSDSLENQAGRRDVTRPGGMFWAVAVLLIVLLLGGAAVVYFLFAGARSVVEEAADLGRALPAIAAEFQSQNITTTFRSALPELTSTGSGNLELATSTVVETISRSDERKVLWDNFSLGETVVEVRTPVTYRYHVRLDDPWQLEVSGQVCIVRAPELQPSLPPAIHTDRLEKFSRSNGWLPSDAAEGFAELERSLTPILSDYAGDPRHLNAVREQSRKTIAAFVQNWLLREGQWGDAHLRAVLVVFPGEDEFVTPAQGLTED